MTLSHCYAIPRAGRSLKAKEKLSPRWMKTEGIATPSIPNEGSILDVCRRRRGHCPWRTFLSCGEILNVETF